MEKGGEEGSEKDRLQRDGRGIAAAQEGGESGEENREQGSGKKRMRCGVVKLQIAGRAEIGGQEIGGWRDSGENNGNLG